MKPAAWWLPERAWKRRMALLRSALSSPHDSYARVNSGRASPEWRGKEEGWWKNRVETVAGMGKEGRGVGMGRERRA